MKNRRLKVLWITLCFASQIVSAYGQQMADPNFDARVAHPAYQKRHPKILFDEAHHNFHTATGRYKAFAELMTNDGYAIIQNKEKFQRKTLAGYEILVIANALGAEQMDMPDAARPAFTDEECDAVRDWVQAGGSLLFIADHAPFGAAAENLARRFGVDMSKGHTSDSSNYDPETGNMGFLIFTTANKLLASHPITLGRDATERVNQVMTFTGQSLKGPAGSVALLKLSDTAIDLTRPTEGEAATNAQSNPLPNGVKLPEGAKARISPGSRGGTSAAGRAQAVAFDFGKGRVVVLGEAAMVSAQVVKGAPAQMLQREEIQIGMNRKGFDNRQLALNLMHWLSRLLK